MILPSICSLGSPVQGLDRKAAAALISTSTSDVARRYRAFWCATAMAVAGGWWLALVVCVFSLLVTLPERDWRVVELAGWALIIVAMTQASIIAALSLFRLAQKRPPEWFSRRVQLWAFILVGLVQLRLVAFLVVEPLTASGRSFGAIPWAILLLGGFQLAGLTAGIRAVRATTTAAEPG
jgi:hypothetical protein